jgi:sodium pump decarboxylase gamma subunit
MRILKNRRKTMDLGFDVVVTITGIVLVFLILILLMAIITLEGKIFDSMGTKKKAAKDPAAKPAAPVQQAAAAPAPQVEEGIPGDVVAAIMAAIHAMGNGKYTLKAVRRSKNGWGNAGVNDTTAPF